MSRRPIPQPPVFASSPLVSADATPLCKPIQEVTDRVADEDVDAEEALAELERLETAAAAARQRAAEALKKKSLKRSEEIVLANSKIPNDPAPPITVEKGGVVSPEASALVGVGVTFKRDRETGIFSVKRIAEGCSAAGLICIGEILIEVEGKTVTGRSYNTLSRLVLGEPGSVVEMGFSAQTDSPDIRRFSLTRVSGASLKETKVSGVIAAGREEAGETREAQELTHMRKLTGRMSPGRPELKLEEIEPSRRKVTANVEALLQQQGLGKRVAFRDEVDVGLEAGPGADTSSSLFPPKMLNRLSQRSTLSVPPPPSGAAPALPPRPSSIAPPIPIPPPPSSLTPPPPSFSAPPVPASSRDKKLAGVPVTRIPTESLRDHAGVEEAKDNWDDLSRETSEAFFGGESPAEGREEEEEEWEDLQREFERDQIEISGEGKHAVRKFNHAYAKVVRSVIDPSEKSRKFDFDEIIPGLYQGRIPRNKRDLKLLGSVGVGAIVSLTEAWEMKLGGISATIADFKENFEHLYLPTPDFSCPPSAAMRAAVDFIAENISKKGVYVHCNAGKSRSAAVCTVYVMKVNGWPAQTAFDFVRSMRPISSLGPWFSSFWTVLSKYEDAIKFSTSLESADQAAAEAQFPKEEIVSDGEDSAAIEKERKKKSKRLDKKAQKIVGDVGKTLASWVGSRSKSKS